MFRPRLRGRCVWFWLGLCSVPLLVWVLALVVTPTGWVKNRLIARLEAETGRSVGIGSVSLGWTGNLRIGDLSFAERQTPTDPWLRIAEARIDVHLGQVFAGCCQPGDVVINGMALRVWRRLDGQFEFGNLARTVPASVPALTPTGQAVDLFPSFNIQVHDGSVQFADDADACRLALTGVTARGSYKALAVRIDDLRGDLNGGTLTLAARLIRDSHTPRFAAEVDAKRVHLDRDLNLIGTFVPLVARADDVIGGQLNVRLALKGQAGSGAEFRRTVTGHGSILLDPIDLNGSRILSELQVLGEWPKEHRVGAVSTNFTVKDERVVTDDLTIRGSKLPFVVAGWTDFDGRFDYLTRVDRMIASLPTQARAVLGELKINLDELSGLRIAGGPGQLHLTVNGRPLSSDPNQPSAERTRFRETARQLRDRFFR